jgi:hypothetical protein
LSVFDGIVKSVVASNKLKQLIDSLPPEEKVKRKIARREKEKPFFPIFLYV